MNSKAHGNVTAARPEAPSKSPWFATFMVLDMGGAISSSQLSRLIAPIKQLWQQVFRHS